jgi:two-component system phosphate regulon sensor histidine kinase PhoR
MAAVAIFALVISRHSAKTFRELSLAVNEAKNGSLDLPTFNNIALDNALYALSAASLELKKSAQENSQLSDRLSYILGHVKEGVILVQEDEIVYRNNRADKILNFTIPNKISEINQASMIALFDKMTSDNPVKELYLGDRVIEVGYNSDGLGRLIVLHDVSDREKYLGFKTDLIANISHELKTPLTLIMATSELIIKDNQMPNEILVKFLNTIFNNSKRLNIILDDLISLHRLETVEGVETAEANLDEILFDVKELIDAKGKEISWNCDQGIVNIHSSHILSVLTNLITNAIKYSSDPKINVGVIKKDNVLEISVADGGPSIPPAERDRIFERFYSLSRSRTRERSGSGLGLSIVKHVAKIYGGQALVTENERGGNTFTVKLVQNKKSAWPD